MYNNVDHSQEPVIGQELADFWEEILEDYYK